MWDRTPRAPIGARLFLLVALLGAPACYHYRVQAPQPNPATEAQKETRWAFFWGLIQDKEWRADLCQPSNALDEVKVSTNLGYAMLTVVTLGIVSPMNLEYRCAKQPSEAEGIP